MIALKEYRPPPARLHRRMHRRSFLSLLGLAPLVPAMSAATPVPASPDPPFSFETWREGPETLEHWRRAARKPIWESPLPELAPLITSIRLHHRIQFCYYGGSTPTAKRIITPGHLYTVTDFPGHYLSGYCHLRQAERTFLMGRMSQLSVLCT